MKYDYDFFLFSQIWIEMSGCAYLPADLMFAQIIASYEDFNKSHSNESGLSMDECIEHYFMNLNAN